MKTWAIDTADGSELCVGLPDYEWRRVAQAYADRLGEDVYAYQQAAGEEPARTIRIRPAMDLTAMAERAGEALGIEIAVHGLRAAHYAEETGRAYWLTRADLAYALDCARNPSTRQDAYSHWCAGSGREMSARAMRRLGYGAR